jgi:hypothetical protein
MSNNLLKLDEPEKYNCKLRQYRIGHSKLEIQVERRVDYRDIFYIVFLSVSYFSGHFKWQIADLNIVSPEECLQYINMEGRTADYKEKFLAKPHRKLYKFVTPTETINIVAASFRRLNERTEEQRKNAV